MTGRPRHQDKILSKRKVKVVADLTKLIAIRNSLTDTFYRTLTVDYGQGLIGILGAVIGGGISLISARQVERFRQRDESKRLLVALFGELLNLERHCDRVIRHIPNNIDSRKKVVDVRMWKHPPLGTLRDDLAQYGFLTNEDIRDVIMLSVAARNDDIWVDAILESINLSKEEDIQVGLQALRQRLTKTQQNSRILIKSIASRNPKLSVLIQFHIYDGDQSPRI
ncbi:hypothetical protein Rvan_2845 [Rhodomicrobium vannielii ATCC 17100]|uniref:Uncharacterized protein n=1 Tax=Rhodomicrobium vannielii (strain ATCC 17100 / DSM 162 / LMG 4299 / NCIMB 10020 / ATH 3.1.1) TaxID=648757 RepID=E3I8S4_RHOVT|nr:hypothetical protein Rvan_2845 [Rhodomicrobium vannielii ATCC 17100]